MGMPCQFGPDSPVGEVVESPEGLRCRLDSNSLVREVSSGGDLAGRRGAMGMPCQFGPDSLVGDSFEAQGIVAPADPDSPVGGIRREPIGSAH